MAVMSECHFHLYAEPSIASNLWYTAGVGWEITCLEKRTVSVASLGLMSPAAATYGVTLPEKLTTFLVIALCKVMTFFSCRLVTTPIFHSGVTTVMVSPGPPPSLVKPLDSGKI